MGKKLTLYKETIKNYEQLSKYILMNKRKFLVQVWSIYLHNNINFTQRGTSVQS